MSEPKTIETYVTHLKAEGWCAVPGVIPENRIGELREHVIQGQKKAVQDYEEWGGRLMLHTGPNGEPGTNVAAYVPELAPYFGDERVVGVVKAMLDPHIRIAQTEFTIKGAKTAPPGDKPLQSRRYHSDWPHDLNDLDNAGAVLMPFPNVTMGITALWMLSPFSAENGGTWVVPRSHLDVRNPRSHLDPRNPPEMHDGIDPSTPIRGEIQLQGDAGSVVLLDSRIWHSGAMNPTDEPRVAVLTRFSPWWISLEFGGRNQAVVPRDAFEKFPDAVKDLYRHRVEQVVKGSDQQDEGEKNLIRKDLRTL